MLGSKAYPMSGTGNPNEYSATIPANEVTSDDLVVVATCNGNDESTTIGSVTLYDPIGRITDSITHQPVAEATVTLYQVPDWLAKTGPQDTRPNTCQSDNSKTAGEAWNQPAPTTLGMLVNTDATVVIPRINQQAADDGYYGWNLFPGCWYVTVEASGYS
nr:MAG: hypothetical protein CSA11_00100 [Chloroflexota bacterium]